MDITDKWKSELAGVSHPEKIDTLRRFFKTGPGEYGEGDVFIGVYVPDNRRISKAYHDAPVEAITEMVCSEVHEHRLAGFLALVERYRKAKDSDSREEVIRLYTALAPHANNWDLVDLSTEYILGKEWSAGRHLDLLEKLSDDELLWHRRIAVVGMLTVIRDGNLDLPLSVCLKQLTHPHQLMQKAVGWILREVGKKNTQKMISYLETHISSISAVTLSYAVERLPKEERARLRNLRKSSLTLQSSHRNR